jgi:hypothetical protein
MQWLQPLVSLGSNKILELEDIWNICPEDSCDELQARFTRNTHFGDQIPSILARIGVTPIVWTMYHTFHYEIMVMMTNYILYLFAMVIQPYLAQALLQVLQNKPNAFNIDNGYILVGLLAIASFVGVTSLNYGFFLSTRIGVNCRSIMMNLVYQGVATRLALRPDSPVRTRLRSVNRP